MRIAIILLLIVESRLILYSSKIVCLLVDWFTGYNGIMIEHLWSGALWNIGVHLKLLFSVNCQTTISFKVILSLHFHHLWVCHIVHHIVPPQMRVFHTVRNVGQPHSGFSFPVGPPPSYCSLQSYAFPSLVGTSRSEFHYSPSHVGPSHWEMWVCHLPQSVTIAFRAIRILSTVGVDIPIEGSFQSFQNPIHSGIWHSCRP